MIKIIRFCLITLLVVAITESMAGTATDTLQGDFYRDINYFDMSGIGKLQMHELDRFPYYRLTKIDEEHRLLELIKQKSSTVELYEKTDNSWLNISYNRETVDHNYIFTYVQKDRIVQLYYAYLFDNDSKIETSHAKKYPFDQKFKLFKVTVRTEFEYTDYSLDYRKAAKWIQPTPEFEKIIDKFSWRSISRTNYSLKDGHILTKKSQDGEIKCYDLIDQWGYKHNLYWEYSFYQIPINCP